MRHGIPMAGNHLMTELIIATGAIEMMIVDYQCIMPALSKVAACYHTKMISTSDKARFPGMEHVEFHPDNAQKKAYDVVKAAIENFANRGETYIPVEPLDAIGGFSVEAVVGALGGTPEPSKAPGIAVRIGIKTQLPGIDQGPPDPLGGACVHGQSVRVVNLGPPVPVCSSAVFTDHVHAGQGRDAQALYFLARINSRIDFHVQGAARGDFESIGACGTRGVKQGIDDNGPLARSR
jgi:hypothetical protein